MTWVKICGTTNLHDAEQSVAAGADALGFIFAVSPRRIEVSAAAEIVAALRNTVETIGVFVNETPSLVAEVADQVGLTGVQLHGDESAASLREYRDALGERKILETVHTRELLGAASLASRLSMRESVDAILLDSGSGESRGGTGIPFAWDEALPAVSAIRAVVPLIIAGGLRADNVARAIELFDPWGVDVVSGVESAPGKKDGAKLRDFVAAVRQTETSARQRG